MDQEHSDIRVTTFGDASEASMQAAGMFPGCKAEIAGEMAARGKAVNITCKSYNCSGTQQADSGYGTQAGYDRITFSQGLEVMFDISDTNLEILDLFT